MAKPITLNEADERLLTTVDKSVAIHTFSNGSERDGWASGNCHACKFYDPDVMGAKCAFEGASFLGMVTPELAELFGWEQDPKWDEPTDHRHGWNYPKACPFFRDRKDDSDNEGPRAPDPDPNQLVLLADPTEDAARILNAPIRELEPVSA